jgi:hypothetical protein
MLLLQILVQPVSLRHELIKAKKQSQTVSLENGKQQELNTNPLLPVPESVLFRPDLFREAFPQSNLVILHLRFQVPFKPDKIKVDQQSSDEN